MGTASLIRALAAGLVWTVVGTGVLQATEPVWPGSNTRFYPGIYPSVEKATPSDIRSYLLEWWGVVDRDRYREYHNGARVSHLGVKVRFWPKDIFSSYWFNHETGPYDYAHSTANSALMQDPNAELEGHAIYNWALFDQVLDLPEVVSGEYKVMFQFDDQDIKSTAPKWWFSQGMMDTGGNPKKYDWSYTRLKMDMLKAWATRYAGDPRVAAFVIEEYAGTINEGPVAGYVAPDQSWQVSAEAGSQIYPAKAMLEADPGLMVILVAPGGYQPDFFTGRGSAPGLDDLPGIQGIAIQDPKFFNGTCGTGLPGEVDCEVSDWGYKWLAQQAWVRNDLPVMSHAEANGFRPRNQETTRRGGNLNPWGVTKWPHSDTPWDGENVGGVADGRKPYAVYPDPMFWAWYVSGAPRAEGDAADSKLGQPGPDPAGMWPSVFYDPTLPWCAEPGCYNPQGRFMDGWNSRNLSIERYRKAFEVFGPSGTKAMLAYPDGYLEQFEGEGLDSKYITVESPADRQTVSPTGPVRISVSPEVAVSEVTVWQDGKEIYRGPKVPGDLALSLRDAAEYSWHQLTVRVTDQQGKEHRRSTSFRVKIPPTPPLQFTLDSARRLSELAGNVTLELQPLALVENEQVEEVQVRLTPVRVQGDGRETPQARTLFAGRTVPAQLTLDTRELVDGVYDLTLTVQTNRRGGGSQNSYRVTVRNWSVITDMLLPPLASTWFGSYERMHTVDRSPGWAFRTDTPESFWGDAERMVRASEHDEYLTWEMPNLRRYLFTVFAQSEAINEVVSIALSPDARSWQDVHYDVRTVGRSEFGWLKLELSGEVAADVDANYVRLTLRPGSLSAEAIQIGEALIVGAVVK